MSLAEQICDWIKSPNSLGSESQAGVILGRIQAHLGEELPPEVRDALKVLSLRGILRDAFKEFTRPSPKYYSEGAAAAGAFFHKLSEAVLACGGMSQVEAIAAITRFFEATLARLQ